MVDSIRLNSKIEEKGLKIEYLARALKMSTGSLYNKRHNKTQFSYSEAICLSNILELTEQERDDIFLYKKLT